MTEHRLRSEVARIAATCDAIASMPTENERAARCLNAVANSLRSALRYVGCSCANVDGPTVCNYCRGRPVLDYGHDCEHTSLQHGADGCNVSGCLCAFMSWDES